MTTRQPPCTRDDHRLYRIVLRMREDAHRKHGDNSIDREEMKL